ncbi:hypothetical protein CTAYLR_006087 [Chrysophaeum taylorii]|uniref:M23ase beta-sheet core domain-containing protein n=1 Tax=Chrysophaeum taylorii TaxID=2483200 RepID=A0AAD7UJE4_9STRA|nr:hypothetical protein CTAYLR_006087 [Chrysophaeum taylorii]
MMMIMWVLLLIGVALASPPPPETFKGVSAVALPRRLEETSTVLNHQRDYGDFTLYRTDTDDTVTFTATNEMFIEYSLVWTLSGTDGDAPSWGVHYEVLEGDADCLSSCKVVAVVPADVEDVEVAVFTSSYGGATIMGSQGDATIPYDGSAFVPPLKLDPVAVTQGYNGTATHQNVNALDMRCPEGEPIYPVRDGYVWYITSQYSEECNPNTYSYAECVELDWLANVVYVNHCDGTTSRYAHFAGPDLISVSVGDYVRARVDELGPCGSTGFSTGSHLHFEVVVGELNANDVVVFDSIRTLWDDCVDPAFIPGDKETFRMDGATCASGYGSCGGGGSSKKKNSLQSSTTLVLIDFVAFFCFGSLSLLLVILCVRALPASAAPTSRDALRSLGLLLVAWFVTCSDITLTYVEYESKISSNAWAFSAATLIIVFVVHASITAITVFTQDTFHDFDWLRDHKFLVFPALFFAVPCLDGFSLVLPWYHRNSVHGFPTHILCAFSTLRLVLLDVPQFILKLVVYQAAVGFSLFAFVSSIASLILIVVLVFRILELLRAPSSQLPPARRYEPTNNNNKGLNRDGPLFIPPPAATQSSYAAPSVVDAEDHPASEMISLEAS